MIIPDLNSLSYAAQNLLKFLKKNPGWHTFRDIQHLYRNEIFASRSFDKELAELKKLDLIDFARRKQQYVYRAKPQLIVPAEEDN